MNQDEHRLRIPFLIIDDPLSRRIALPIIEIMWIVCVVASALFIFFILKHALGNNRELIPLIMVLFLFLSIIVLIFWSLNTLISTMLYEFLIIKPGKIIHFCKIIKRDKQIDTKDVEKLLSKKTNGNHAAVYLVRKNGVEVLIDKFGITFGMHKWDTFIKKLGMLSNLPLYEEEE